MRLYYIWWRGSKRAKIWSREGCSWEVMTVKGSNRRFSFRSVMATVLVVGVILPFVYISAAFLALEGASKCSSSAVFSNCLGLRFGPEFLRGSDTSMKLGNDLRKAFLEGKEAATGTHEVVGIGTSLQSFENLVAHISSNRQDIKTFVSMAKHMVLFLSVESPSTWGVEKGSVGMRWLQKGIGNCGPNVPLPCGAIIAHVLCRWSAFGFNHSRRMKVGATFHPYTWHAVRQSYTICKSACMENCLESRALDAEYLQDPRCRNRLHRPLKSSTDPQVFMMRRVLC